MESRVPLQRVHFFEMVAQEKFTKYLRSALLYVSNVFFDKLPFLVPLRYHKGLILSIVELLIEYTYLRKNESTYSEYFYSIKRVSQNHDTDPTISKSGTLKTLILVSLLPIAKQYIDNYFNKKKIEIQEGNQSLAIKLFLRIYPFVNMAYECLSFLYNIRYLLQPKSKYFSPIYHLLKHEVTKIDEENTTTPGKYGFLLDTLKKYFVFFLFLLTKFFEWYFDTDRRRAEVIQSHESVEIDPPFKDDKAILKNICPICHKIIKFPSCLDVSGYVFCQTCIIDYVKKHLKCPMTNLQCDINNVHKIYDH